MCVVSVSEWEFSAVDRRASPGLSTGCATRPGSLEQPLNSTRSRSAEHIHIDVSQGPCQQPWTGWVFGYLKLRPPRIRLYMINVLYCQSWVLFFYAQIMDFFHHFPDKFILLCWNPNGSRSKSSDTTTNNKIIELEIKMAGSDLNNNPRSAKVLMSFVQFIYIYT